MRGGAIRLIKASLRLQMNQKWISFARHFVSWVTSSYLLQWTCQCQSVFKILVNWFCKSSRQTPHSFMYMKNQTWLVLLLTKKDGQIICWSIQIFFIFLELKPSVKNYPVMLGCGFFVCLFFIFSIPLFALTFFILSSSLLILALHFGVIPCNAQGTLWDAKDLTRLTMYNTSALYAELYILGPSTLLLIYLFVF